MTKARTSFGTKTARVALLLVSTTILLPGCSDDCGCDLPRGEHDWYVEISLNGVPSVITAYPVLAEVAVAVRHLETGQPAPDGFMVVLSASPGLFDNGLPQIELPLLGGSAVATLRIDSAGTYEITVGLEGNSSSFSTTFSVGM
jgi:hypothetical protein